MLSSLGSATPHFPPPPARAQIPNTYTHNNNKTMKPSDSLLCSTVLAPALTLAGPGKFCVLITLHKFVFINRQWHWALGIAVCVCVCWARLWSSDSCLHLHLFGAAVKYFMAVKKSKSSECLHFVRAWQGCGCCCC